MGFEGMRAIRKGQAAIFNLTQDIRGEARIVERAFGIVASALAEAVAVNVNNSNSNRTNTWREPRPSRRPCPCLLLQQSPSRKGLRKLPRNLTFPVDSDGAL